MLRNFQDNKNLITWALTYTTINGHWLTLQVTSRSEGELNDLLTSTPRVGLLTPGCLMTARKILFFLATDHRFSQPEDQDLTDLIAADNNRLELLKSYHTDAINQTAYQLFKHWSHLAYMAVKYIMDKTLASVQIIELCPPFLKKISDLPSYTNQLMLGLKSKIELQGVGRKHLTSNKKLLTVLKNISILLSQIMHLLTVGKPSCVPTLMHFM